MDGRADRLQPCPVEVGWLPVDAVDVADRHREAIAPRLGHELDRLAGIGQRPGGDGLCDVLVTGDPAELALHPGAPRVGQVGRPAHELDVGGIGPRRSIGHDRAAPGVQRGLDHGQVVAVVELDARPRVRALGDGEQRRQQEWAVPVAEDAPADQEDDALSPPRARRENGCGDLEVVAREGPDGRPLARREQVAERDEHRQTRATWVSLERIEETSSTSSRGPPTLPGTTT